MVVQDVTPLRVWNRSRYRSENLSVFDREGCKAKGAFQIPSLRDLLSDSKTHSPELHVCNTSCFFIKWSREHIHVNICIYPYPYLYLYLYRYLYLYLYLHFLMHDYRIHMDIKDCNPILLRMSWHRLRSIVIFSFKFSKSVDGSYVLYSPTNPFKLTAYRSVGHLCKLLCATITTNKLFPAGMVSSPHIEIIMFHTTWHVFNFFPGGKWDNCCLCALYGVVFKQGSLGKAKLRTNSQCHWRVRRHTL